MKTWTGAYRTYHVDTYPNNLPLELEIKPMTRHHHYPQLDISKYSSGPNKRVHMLIHLKTKIHPTWPY